MAVILLLVLFAVGFFGYVVWVGAKTSIHEMAALILFLHADLLFCAAMLLSAVNRSGNKVAKAVNDLRDDLRKVAAGSRSREQAERVKEVR